MVEVYISKMDEDLNLQGWNSMRGIRKRNKDEMLEEI